MQEIDTPHLGAFVGRYRPYWGRAWPGGIVPEFGLLVESDGVSHYRICGEGDIRCRPGTLLVRRFQPDRDLTRTYVRFTKAGRWPFVLPHWTPLSRAVMRCVWQA